MWCVKRVADFFSLLFSFTHLCAGLCVTLHTAPGRDVFGEKIGSGYRSSGRRCDTPLRVPRKIPQLLKRSCRGQQRKACLLAGDVDVSPGAETVLTFPSVGGATDIHYYLGVQLIQTLNSTELLPHHRTVSRCLEERAEPA